MKNFSLSVKNLIRKPGRTAALALLTGAFYMDASALEKALEVEGVEKAAPQTFLASLKADCCSIKIQLIGIDPEKDFPRRSGSPPGHLLRLEYKKSRLPEPGRRYSGRSVI